MSQVCRNYRRGRWIGKLLSFPKKSWWYHLADWKWKEVQLQQLHTLGEPCQRMLGIRKVSVGLERKGASLQEKNLLNKNKGLFKINLFFHLSPAVPELALPPRIPWGFLGSQQGRAPQHHPCAWGHREATKESPAMSSQELSPQTLRDPIWNFISIYPAALCTSWLYCGRGTTFISVFPCSLCALSAFFSGSLPWLMFAFPSNLVLYI